jgi:hypothetical protein
MRLNEMKILAEDIFESDDVKRLNGVISQGNAAWSKPMSLEEILADIKQPIPKQDDTPIQKKPGV